MEVTLEQFKSEVEALVNKVGNGNAANREKFLLSLCSILLYEHELHNWDKMSKDILKSIKDKKNGNT